MIGLRAGRHNDLADVPGIRVGHATLAGDGALSGVTVVLAAPEGAVGGVDVRGGGPGTRETDLLDPRCVVERVHGVVLSGGSAYGLATADGVMARLAADEVGFAVGRWPHEVVPIVPAAVLFDLGRGGAFGRYPTAATGAVAYDDASDGPVAQGCVGAGEGAVAGGLKGGVGSASVLLPGGGVVGALAVVNSRGSTVDPETGELYGARCGLPGEFGAPPNRPFALPAETDAPPPLATTLVVLASDVTLTKAQCARLAAIGHDGMARAIRPVHTTLDGDTVFALSTGSAGAPDPAALHTLLDTGGDCVSRAIAHAMLAASTVQTAVGRWLSYEDALNSAP